MELLGNPLQRNLSEMQASRKQGENYPATSCFSLLRGRKTLNWCFMALSAPASTPTPLPWAGRRCRGRELACCHPSSHMLAFAILLTQGWKCGLGKQAQILGSEDQYDALQLGGMIFPFQPLPVLLRAITSCTVAVVGTITLL